MDTMKGHKAQAQNRTSSHPCSGLVYTSSPYGWDRLCHQLTWSLATEDRGQQPRQRHGTGTPQALCRMNAHLHQVRLQPTVYRGGLRILERTGHLLPVTDTPPIITNNTAVRTLNLEGPMVCSLPPARQRLHQTGHRSILHLRPSSGHL